tara:strand:+ start:717 stop:1007 length:291 start_codon:yes stop_codon:yes gene_type:complete
VIIKRWKFKGFNNISLTNDFPDWIKLNTGKRHGNDNLWAYTQTGEVPVMIGEWISINLRGHLEVHSEKPKLIYGDIVACVLCVTAILIVVVALMAL